MTLVPLKSIAINCLCVCFACCCPFCGASHEFNKFSSNHGRVRWTGCSQIEWWIDKYRHSRHLPFSPHNGAFALASSITILVCTFLPFSRRRKKTPKKLSRLPIKEKHFSDSLNLLTLNQLFFSPSQVGIIITDEELERNLSDLPKTETAETKIDEETD